ncbi:MAG TPA: nuclear transport factor 2 family protein, partial [Solirubrobacterales bacterium]|nr:nuclear transport factor 2 family protein [Solirubrobacterales bacterium]
MTEQEAELVRRGFERLREAGVEGLLPFIHPEFEVTTPASLAAEPDTYRGREGIRRYFDSFGDAM